MNKHTSTATSANEYMSDNLVGAEVLYSVIGAKGVDTSGAMYAAVLGIGTSQTSNILNRPKSTMQGTPRLSTSTFSWKKI